MTADGVPDQLCRYCSLGLATTRYAKAGEAPWGGLPKPRLLCARLTCDCIHRVFSLWAEAFDAELFEIDNPGASELPPRWWELTRHRWRELIEPHRLDVRRGDARASHRTARVDRRTASRPRSAARASRTRQSARRDFRRGAAADRSRTRDARAHDRADRERHGDAVGARNGLGARACAAFLRRAARARRRRHRGLPRREAAAHVGRRGAVARHGFLYCVRGLARRRLRLVDVSRLRPGRLHSLRARRSARRAREPHGELQRVSAQPAVGGRVDSSRRRASIASTRRSCCTRGA